MRLAQHPVGPGHPCFVIAEAGVNHNGEIDLGLRLVDAAADAGATAVKFQTFRASELTSQDAPKAEYQKARTSQTETQRQLLARLELSLSTHRMFMERAAARGIVFCSTPFDFESADLLDALDVPFLKVSSGDLTYITLLRHLARTKRPLVISTGMADLPEVDLAVSTVREAGAADVALLHCVSQYPSPFEDVNLLAMRALSKRYGLPVGYSDHTEGLDIAVAAAALGASIVEKHLTLDRTLPGPDHAASLEPAEFAEMVRRIRRVERSLGDGVKSPRPSELDNRRVVRRGLRAAVDLAGGTVLSRSDLVCQRPEEGIPSAEFDRVLGRRLVRGLSAGERLEWSHLDVATEAPATARVTQE